MSYGQRVERTRIPGTSKIDIYTVVHLAGDDQRRPVRLFKAIINTPGGVRCYTSRKSRRDAVERLVKLDVSE